MSDRVASPGLEKLLYMLAAETKANLKKHCHEATVTESDFADLIEAGIAGHLEPFQYANHFSDWVPADAPPSPEQMRALFAHRDGPFPPDAQRAFGRVMNSFVSRKLYAAHLFYQPSGERWRLFYFNQKYRSRFDNHWVAGEHIHVSSEHFTQSDLTTVWIAACENPPSPPKGLHVRYIRADG